MKNYYQQYSSGDDVTPTEYNSNAFTIIFLDKLNNTFTSAMFSNDYDTAINALDNIFSELTFKPVKGFSVEGLENQIEVLKKEIIKCESKHRHTDGKLYYLYPELRERVHLSLMRLKRELGRLKHKLGLGLTEKDDPKFAFAADPDLHGRSTESEFVSD